MSDRFDYGKAEADLYDSGCPYSEEIYGYRSEKGINEFMRENGLNPDRYYSGDSNNGVSGNGASNGSGCFITTACVEARGLDDDCYELYTLRQFRDTYLKDKAGGKSEIAEYYRTAPQIVEIINNRSDAAKIWEDIFQNMISPCIVFIENQKEEDAYALYKSAFLKLKTEYLQ